MKWYIDRIIKLNAAEPILSACGDDCAVCPRYVAKTDCELNETAKFWYKLGWRDRVVSNDEIRCEGCAGKVSCGFSIVECKNKNGIADCRNCGSFVCERIENAVSSVETNKQRCRELCESEEEFIMLSRAFFEKKKNFGIAENK